MSYYDDDDDYDDYDDECSSEDDIYYHNYSVDYANQILSGQHAISSCLPRMRRKHHRHSPRLVRVATLDQMPLVNRHQIHPSLRSRPKYGDDDEDISSSTAPPPPPLPSLESTNEELERRATRRTQPTSETTPNNVPSSTENTQRPLTEAELRQVQQQQEAFQQHLMNMQRHLLEQSQQVQEQQVPPSLSSTSHHLRKRTKVSYHDIERDDDQAEIARLIENDPYFAAAMEDFAYTHGLLHNHRHRTHSDYSSTDHSHRSQRLCKRHQAELARNQSRLSHPSSLSSSSSSSSSHSKSSSSTNATAQLRGSNADQVLFRELHGIRRLMEEYIRDRRNQINPNQGNISIMPVPWPMTGLPFQTPTGVHYPPVPPVTDYQPSLVPREGPPRAPEPNRSVYQNVVNAVKDVLDRRSPTHREQPLKPSEIDPKLKHVYTRRPQIPSSNIQPTSLRRPPTSLSSQQQPQPRRRRRSSQMSTPPIIQLATAPPPSNNIPPAPPYEPLTNFSTVRPATNTNRNLSYGKRPNRSNLYDTLRPGHYLRLYTNKYN